MSQVGPSLSSVLDLSLEDSDDPDDVLTADWALGELLSAICARRHVAALLVSTLKNLFSLSCLTLDKVFAPDESFHLRLTFVVILFSCRLRPYP